MLIILITSKLDCLIFLLDVDYVQLLNLNGQLKAARRHHAAVDMQFEFRIEAAGILLVHSSDFCS